MQDTRAITQVRRKYRVLSMEMDERGRRQWAAAEARELGWGGVTAVASATGLSRTTVSAGLRELELPDAQRAAEGRRVRRPGGGRKALTESDPGLLVALEALIEPTTRGDPESPLRWTCKSTRRLADELTRQRHPVSVNTVASLLRQAGYSLQANRKKREGAAHPDRSAQFEHINAHVRQFQDQDQPAISVDTQKKELIGDFKNAGREWRPRGRPEDVRVHDFPDKKLGKAIPYGVYDMVNNQGWVSVGIDHDTAQFAAHTIRLWWRKMGRRRFPQATELLITADGGGSNSPRSRLWKVSPQALADELGLRLHVCHFPPGTSKWNRIEHRLFSFITQNWRGRPLVSHQTVVSLIAGTTTRTGLLVKAALDTNRYDTAIKVTDEQLDGLRLTPHPFHGDWNYILTPHRKRFFRRICGLRVAAGAPPPTPEFFEAWAPVFQGDEKRPVTVGQRGWCLGRTVGLVIPCPVASPQSPIRLWRNAALVIPAQAGIQLVAREEAKTPRFDAADWTPACAGMTDRAGFLSMRE